MLPMLRHDVARFAKVEFSGSEIWKRFYFDELIRVRAPKRWKIALSEFLESFLELLLVERVQHHEALAFFLVRDCCDDKDLIRRARQIL